MFQLYALLKVHLAEEEAYLRIVEHGVTADVGGRARRRAGAPGRGLMHRTGRQVAR